MTRQWFPRTMRLRPPIQLQNEPEVVLLRYHTFVGKQQFFGTFIYS